MTEPLDPGLIPEELARSDLVRDGRRIAPGARFWCYPLGTCTALERPDERGRFRGTYRQYLSDGTDQEVTAVFHVGMVAR